MTVEQLQEAHDAYRSVKDWLYVGTVPGLVK